MSSTLRVARLTGGEEATTVSDPPGDPEPLRLSFSGRGASPPLRPHAERGDEKGEERGDEKGEARGVTGLVPVPRSRGASVRREGAAQTFRNKIEPPPEGGTTSIR